MNNKCPVVKAYAVNPTSIWFKCPFHKKNSIHHHGSCGDLTNRLEHRCSHCSCKELENGYYVEIDDNTQRAWIGKSNQVLKRDRDALQRLHEKQIKKNLMKN